VSESTDCSFRIAGAQPTILLASQFPLVQNPGVTYSHETNSFLENLLMAKAAKKPTKNVLAMRRPASSSESESAIPSSTDIARRAFEIYCERGCRDGYDMQDWLQAERELSATASSTAA